MFTYALLDTTHGSYNSVIAKQKVAFDKQKGSTNFKPVLNLAGTQALIKAYDKTNLPSPVVIQNPFDPFTRIMTEWESPDPFTI